MNILLLGANGQVGHALLDPLKSLGTVLAATRNGALANGPACLQVDLADAGSLQRVLEASAPQIIVNAAAYTAVDQAEDEAELADAINHRALAIIGEWAVMHGASVVHYSTDYVFDGKAEHPWREEDGNAPLGIYGRSKRDGEDALRASGALHLILRTAWVYAAHGRNFLNTMLRLAAERDELRVVNDQVGSPTPAHWIAEFTAAILLRWMQMNEQGREQVSGTYHLTASQHCSWFEFAQAILREAQAAGLTERTPRMVPIGSAEFPTRARRPAFSVLDNAKLERTFGLRMRTWHEGLKEVIGQLAINHLRGEVS